MKSSESNSEATMSPVDCHCFHLHPGDRFFFSHLIWAQAKSNRTNKLPGNSPGAANLITGLSTLWRYCFKWDSKAVSFLCCLLSPGHFLDTWPARQGAGGRLEDYQVKNDTDMLYWTNGWIGARCLHFRLWCSCGCTEVLGFSFQLENLNDTRLSRNETCKLLISMFT